MGYAGEVEWMNQEGNSAIGFTAQREVWANNGFMSMDKDGTFKAWWQQDGYKAAFPGPIPVEYINEKMLHWQAQECDIAVKLYVGADDDPHGSEQDAEGNTYYYRWVADEGRKAIVRPDNQAIFQYAGRDSYQVHGYMPILDQCANIADGELGMASAFLMDMGGVFVGNMELPEDITTEEGIAHRIRLMVCSSMNSRFATLWKIVDEFCVCSNSFNLNLKGDGNEFRVKHTSKSLGRINDARQALGLVYKAAEEYSKFLDAMTKVDVTDAQFKALLNTTFTIPLPDVQGGKVKNQAAITKAENKQGEVLSLWQGSDPRVAPFRHTLFGAFQAWSTWNQHSRPNGDALAANILGTVSGAIAEADQAFFDIVSQMEDIDLRPLADALV